MMAAEQQKRFRIVESTSRHAGAWVGRATIVGKIVVGAGVGGAAAVGNLLSRPFKARPPESDHAAPRRGLKQPGRVARRARAQLASRLRALQAEKEALISDLGKLRSEVSETGAAENALRERLAALETELATVRHDLDEARSEAEQAQSRLASQLKALEAENESELAPVRRQAAGVRCVEIDTESQQPSPISAVQTERGTALSDRGEKKVVVEGMEKAASATEATSARTAPAHAPSPPEVTLDEVRAAVFPNAADKILLTTALCDIGSQDAAVRADAARAMGGVHHEFSVRALVAQLARERSPQVQQECIKALVKLEMKDGLPAIERLLTDPSASVRLAAVWGLYRLGRAESASALAGALSDEDEEVRRRAATCIGWLGQEELAVQLSPLLDDSSVSVRRAAVEALGSLRSRQGVSALIERLNDPEESIRRAALTAIETISGRKMSDSFPEGEKSHQLLIARWREWWKDEHRG